MTDLRACLNQKRWETTQTYALALVEIAAALPEQLVFEDPQISSLLTTFFSYSHTRAANDAVVLVLRSAAAGSPGNQVSALIAVEDGPFTR